MSKNESNPDRIIRIFAAMAVVIAAIALILVALGACGDESKKK